MFEFCALFLEEYLKKKDGGVQEWQLKWSRGFHSILESKKILQKNHQIYRFLHTLSF